MLKSILDYQRSSERLIDALKSNNKVLAIFAFGSIVNGDLWEGSDIDLFVVYEDTFEEIRDIYSEVLDIPVHIKVLSKERFLSLYESDARKGIIRNLINSSTATCVLVARSWDELVLAVTHERPIRPNSKGVYACVITKAPSTMLDQ